MKKITYLFAFLMVVYAGLNSSCERAEWSEDYDVEFPTPTITNFSPENARVGDVITVSGTNLDKVTVVSVGGKTMNGIDEQSAVQLKFKLSAGTQGGIVMVKNIYRRTANSEKSLTLILN